MADAASLFKKKKKGKAKKPMKFNANVENEVAAKKVEETSARQEPVSAVDATWGGNEPEIRVATGGRETEELVNMSELMRRDEHKLLEERVAKERAQEQFKATRQAQQERGTGDDPMAVAQPPPGATSGLGGMQSYKPGGWREREAKRKAEEVTRTLNDTSLFPDLATAAKMPSDASTDAPRPRFGFGSSRTGRFGAAGPGLAGYRIGRGATAAAAPEPEPAAAAAPVAPRATGVWAKQAAGDAEAKAVPTADGPGEAQTAAPAVAAEAGPPADAGEGEAAALNGAADAGTGSASPAAAPEEPAEPAEAVDLLDKASLAAKFGTKKKKKPKKETA